MQCTMIFLSKMVAKYYGDKNDSPNMYCGSGNIRKVLIWVNFLRRGQILIRELKNIANFFFIIALLKKHENSRILNFVKSPKIGNSQKF